MSLLLGVIIVQLIVIIFGVFILKFVLNNMLVDLAVRHIEVWKVSDAKNIDRIMIMTQKPLKQIYVKRVQQALKRAFAENVHIEYKVQKALLGGAILCIGEKIIDCSLKDRLRQAFGA